MNFSQPLQPMRLSETLYEIYGKIHQVSELTLKEHQILQVLSQDPFINDEHRDMITRIFYKLNRNQRQKNRLQSKSS